jgi:glycine cleavage system H lipoate-binding protein
MKKDWTETKASKMVKGDPTLFPPTFWKMCTINACGGCPYRGVCFAASANERQVDYVDGFMILQDLYYNTNHLWVKPRKGGMVRIGLDDFAQKIVGEITEHNLPQVGAEIKRGEALWDIVSGSRSASLQSPFDAVVAGINKKVAGDAQLVNRDSYGKGWVLSLQPSKMDDTLKELFFGRDANRWMEKEVDQLYVRMESELGITMADGGNLNLIGKLDDDEWHSLAAQFLTM